MRATDQLARPILRGAGIFARQVRPPGRDRFARWVSQRGVERIVYRDGDDLTRVADLRDALDARWFFGATHIGLPPDVLSRLRPGDFVLDAGANIGITTGQLCCAVGRSGRVWAVDPLPANVARLVDLKTLNALDQLEIAECALAATHGDALFRVPDLANSSAWGSFTASWVSGATIKVPTRTLDDLVAERESPLALIKIDVEGAEALVLRGANDTLKRDRPLIYCEFNDIVLRDANTSAKALLDEFLVSGYKVAPGYVEQAHDLDHAIIDLLLEPIA